MRWPWQEPEKRSGVYTDALIAAHLSRASGTVQGNPSALAALEVASGLWSRSLSIARVEPQDEVTRAITPSFLATVGRSIVRHGIKHMGHHRIQWAGCTDGGEWMGHNGRGRILRAGATPWSLPRPSGSERLFMPSEGVLHFSWGHDDRPWAGVSPLGFAASSAASAAGLEQRLSEELSGPVAHLLPIPQDGGDNSDDDPLGQLKADIAGA